jgi:CheY-like chemotaxis protein
MRRLGGDDALRVLVVEDEPKLRELIRAYLERDGFGVLSTGSGAEAITLAARSDPDLIMLDLRLPDIAGEDVTRELRRASDVPILMLTAKAAEEDRIAASPPGDTGLVVAPEVPLLTDVCLGVRLGRSRLSRGVGGLEARRALSGHSITSFRRIRAGGSGHRGSKPTQRGIDVWARWRPDGNGGVTAATRPATPRNQPSQYGEWPLRREKQGSVDSWLGIGSGCPARTVGDPAHVQTPVLGIS